MHQYERAVTKIKKENNLMILRRSRYHMLQLAEELAATTNRQLTPVEHNNVLNYGLPVRVNAYVVCVLCQGLS